MSNKKPHRGDAPTVVASQLLMHRVLAYEMQRAALQFQTQAKPGRGFVLVVSRGVTITPILPNTLAPGMVVRRCGWANERYTCCACT